jgi:hypothetical protein
MAVKLRCPECKHTFRLPVDPEPDSEMECPECGHAYPIEENIVRAGGSDEDEEPRKKKKGGGDGGVKTKTKKKGKKAAGPEQPKGPKKRKMKKRKTPPALIAAIVVGVLMFVGTVGGVLIWFFTKKSAFQEMMTYLPDDCDEVFGLNVGHLQKYPEFYKNCENVFANTGFKKAGDVFAKALGQGFNDVVEQVVQGTNTTTVLRSKEEFDPGALAKIPGAKKYSGGGVDYYTIPDIPELGYPGLRVFAPTNRLVVFCTGSIPQAKFNAMLTGNKDNADATVVARAGPLAKQTMRGTVWKFSLYGRGIAKPSGPAAKGGEAGGQPSDEDQLKSEIASLASSAQGSGYKASVGSREIRGEWILWYKESSGASEQVKKWKEKDWIKDDEKEAPKWWKALANKSGGGKTAPNILKDNLSFTSSGELFSIRTAMETKLIQQSVGTLVGAFTQQQGGGGGPGGPPGGPPAGPPGGGALPGPGGGVVMPSGPRRRRVVPL